MDPIIAAGTSALPRGLPPWLLTGSHDRAQAPVQDETPGLSAENTYRVMPASPTRTDPTRLRPTEITVGRLGLDTSSSSDLTSRDPTCCAPALPAAGEVSPARTAGAGAARCPATAKATLVAVTAPAVPTATAI